MSQIRIFFIFSFFLILVSGYAKTSPIDSLKQYMKTAKPGWDQIDVVIGLAKLYIAKPDVEKAKESIELIYRLSDKYELPQGKAYALIMKNQIAYMYENDDDKAIAHCIEAMKIARETGCKDALMYAGHQLSENYAWEKGDFEKANILLLELIVEIDETILKKNLANLYKGLGFVQAQLGNHQEGLQNMQKALAILKSIVIEPDIDPRVNRVSAQNINNELQVCTTTNYIGDIYVSQGNIDLAMEYKQEALKVAEDAGLLPEIAWMHQNIGVLYSENGHYLEALKFVKKAKIVFEELEIKYDIIICNNILVDILRKLKDYDVAEQYAQESIDYYQETGDSLFLSRGLLAAVNIQLGKEDWSKAQLLLDQAEPLAIALANVNNLALVAQAKAHITLGIGNHVAAKAYHKDAMRLFMQVKNEPGVVKQELNLANVFLKLEEYDSATYYSKQALQHAKKNGDRDVVRNCYLFLSKLYQTEKNYKMAFENHKRFFAFHDSIYNSDAQSKLKEEQVRQNIVTYKNEKELAEQNANLLADKNRTYLILGLVLFCFLLVIVYFYINQRKVKARIESQNIQLSQLNRTKDKFFGIIAHDIRSPLLGLQSVGEQIDYFTKKEQPERLKELSEQVEVTTKKLTDLLDNLLNWALLQNGMIPYHPEQINLKEVMVSVFELLQPLANMKNINFQNRVEGDVFVFADSKAVDTILRNIVANALKFTHEDGEVSVAVMVEDDKAKVTINDTGTGISAEKLPKLFDLEHESVRGTMGEKGSGLGLVLSKELVELNRGNIMVNSELGKGSSFVFDLPVSSTAA